MVRYAPRPLLIGRWLSAVTLAGIVVPGLSLYV
jgi:hypothetical protein